MSGIALGMKLGRERLRGAGPWIVLVFSALSVFAFAALERQSDRSSAADSALEGAVFGLALPLLAYLLSERVCDGSRLDRCVEPVARYGADRRAVLFGVLLVAALGTALLGVTLALVAVLGAHASRDADFAGDLRASVVIAALSGVVYACFFGAASLLGKRGGGRKWALIGDFILGAGGSALAAPFPRGHVRNLLGGAPVLDLSQGAAGIALLVIGLGCVALSLSRTPS
jgi:hypothetical protein